MKDLGRVFQEEDAASAERSGGGRSLDGSVKCLQVLVHITVCLLATVLICY